MNVVDADVEQMARKMISMRGMDPDQLVQAGSPTIYGTPKGDMFAVVPGAEEELWRSYTGIAREYLNLARTITLPGVEIAEAAE